MTPGVCQAVLLGTGKVAMSVSFVQFYFLKGLVLADYCCSSKMKVQGIFVNSATTAKGFQQEQLCKGFPARTSQLLVLGTI